MKLNKLFALIIIIFLIPLGLIISLGILITSGFPVFFIQKRIGLGQEIFFLFKFRTMVNRKTINQFKEKVIEDNDPRVTKFGSILRRTSLDELPQLFNIIKGDMNFVGPRPILPEQCKAIPDEYLGRFNVKPGITGLAQIRGRRGLDWFNQLRYDVFYSLKKNFCFDLFIIYKTFFEVIQQKGINGTNVKNWREYINDL